MPSFLLNNKEIEFSPGEDILTAALRAGEFIPHYCYHPGLSRVATCRMCMVDVPDAGNGKPLPKLQTSCTTPVAANMKVVTDNAKVKLAREAVLEFLLVNHPLDCPICDQSGECSLQDYSFQYGTGKSQVEHEKRIYGVRDIGTFLQLERNRCIHCTRCVRFTNEISGTHEMGMFGRNHQLTVDTFIDYPLTDLFQGNIADICPVGAITMKDFRFRKRVWKLKKTPSVCTGCSTGCNVWVNHHEDAVYRLTPRENQAINKWWMCDPGRLTFRDYTDIDKRRLQTTAGGNPVSWKQAGQIIREQLQQQKTDKRQIVFLLSATMTCEEIWVVKTFTQKLGMSFRLLGLNGPAEKPVSGVFTEDLIMNDKSPNRAGLKAFGVELTDDIIGQLKKMGNPGAVIIIGNEFDSLPDLSDALSAYPFSVHISALKSLPEKLCTVSLPAVSFFEKDGHFINKTGVLQKNSRSVPKAYNTKTETEIFSELFAGLFPNDAPLADADSISAGIAATVGRSLPDNVNQIAPPIPSLSYCHA